MICLCTCYIATRSRYIPCGYNVQYICITNNTGTIETQKIYKKYVLKTTAKNARNATTKPPKNHYKVHLQWQMNYCKT